MDVATLLLTLMVKTFLLAMPVSTAWLAFRRLSLSETTNAWIYAGTGLYAAFSAAGLAPWALGLQAMSWPFLLFSAMCPPLWVAVVILCGIGRSPVYDLPEEENETEAPGDFWTNLRPKPLPPLLLGDPVFTRGPEPIFRHRPAQCTQTRAEREPVVREKLTQIDPALAVDTPRSVLTVARDMRGHPTAERRRTRRMLPPPHAMSDLPHLPFLPGSGTA